MVMRQIKMGNRMLMKVLKFGFLMVGVLFMFGCREYQLYQYKPVTVDVAGGEVFVELVGMYGENYEKDGKRKADFTYPYTLRFVFEAPLDYEFTRFTVTDVKVVGGKSGKEAFLPDLKSGKLHGPDKYYPDLKSRIAKASLGGLGSDRFEYEDLSLRATVIIYNGDTKVSEEAVSILLKTNFKKSNRSDKFDEYMSV